MAQPVTTSSGLNVELVLTDMKKLLTSGGIKTALESGAITESQLADVADLIDEHLAEFVGT